MIPFATPSPGEFVNLTMIIRARRSDDDTLEVTFADGTKRIYTGKQNEIMVAEIAFSTKTYRDYQKLAVGDAGMIVTPDGGRVM